MKIEVSTQKWSLMLLWITMKFVLLSVKTRSSVELLTSYPGFKELLLFYTYNDNEEGKVKKKNLRS